MMHGTKEYWALHHFIRKQLPKSENGQCEHCHQIPKFGLQLYSWQNTYDWNNLLLWSWSCSQCNMNNPLTKSSIAKARTGWVVPSDLITRRSALIRGRKHPPGCRHCVAVIGPRKTEYKTPGYNYEKYHKAKKSVSR